jgi:DNA-binding transcriptional ArsR family regulator
MVLDVRPANANHMFRALADPTRRAIFERLARRQRNDLRTIPKTHSAERKG